MGIRLAVRTIFFFRFPFLASAQHRPFLLFQANPICRSLKTFALSALFALSCFQSAIVQIVQCHLHYNWLKNFMWPTWPTWLSWSFRWIWLTWSSWSTWSYHLYKLMKIKHKVKGNAKNAYVIARFIWILWLKSQMVMLPNLCVLSCSW